MQKEQVSPSLVTSNYCIVRLDITLPRRNERTRDFLNAILEICQESLLKLCNRMYSWPYVGENQTILQRELLIKRLLCANQATILRRNPSESSPVRIHSISKPVRCLTKFEK